MSILDRLAGAIGYERRAADPSWAALSAGGTVTDSGATVNARTAENIAAALACVNAVSSALASLPVYVYRTVAGGREEDPQHPVAKLIRRPNQHQSWPDWCEWTLSEALRYGNALSIIESDATGQPTALVPIPWLNVAVTLLPSGALVYDVVRFGPQGGTGQPRRYLAHEVLHLRDRSDDGLIGRSRLSRAAETVGNALALQNFSATTWKNQAVPGGVLKIAGALNADQFARLRAQFGQSHTGTANARKPIVLDNGMTWEPMGVSPEDAELLASRRFSVEEICRLFQVPPPIVQDLSHGTFTNSREAGRWFAQFSLAPWARKLEAEFSRSVFVGDSHHLEIDLSGLVRGDFSERWAAWKIAVDSTILDPNEIREIEGFNPRGSAAP